MFHIPKIAMENSSIVEMTAGELMSFVMGKNAMEILAWEVFQWRFDMQRNIWKS